MDTGHSEYLSYLPRFRRQPAFPTRLHLLAAEEAVDYFAADSRVEAVLLTGSCARGVASKDSCVDVTLLVTPSDLASMEGELPRCEQELARLPACAELSKAVPWSAIDLGVSYGEFTPGERGWTSGPDRFELEIGNTLAWVHPMLLRGGRFRELQRAYLPYYDEALRTSRLAAAIRYASNNLAHVGPYALRHLSFQAFKRLYHAMEEYLQALLIHRRIYPIAYDKWVEEQVAEILGEPGIYARLKSMLATPSLSVHRLVPRAAALGDLLEELRDPSPDASPCV